VSEYLVHQGVATSQDRDAFWKEWGIDTHLEARGGVAGIKAEPHARRGSVPVAAQEIQGR
jgi:2,4-dienoyl-CoA reductase (NADPH2)